MAPSEQDRATACVTPALVMANTNAVSRQPETATAEILAFFKLHLYFQIPFEAEYMCTPHNFKKYFLNNNKLLSAGCQDKLYQMTCQDYVISCPQLSFGCLVRDKKKDSPRLTILPNTTGLWVVGQFQRRLRNCHLHSCTAVCRPVAMACRIPGFWRIRRRWRRLSRARLGSRTNCMFLELMSRLAEEATFIIPLA